MKVLSIIKFYETNVIVIAVLCRPFLPTESLDDVPGVDAMDDTRFLSVVVYRNAINLQSAAIAEQLMQDLVIQEPQVQLVVSAPGAHESPRFVGPGEHQSALASLAFFDGNID